jgi:hypothetical protein
MVFELIGCYVKSDDGEEAERDIRDFDETEYVVMRILEIGEGNLEDKQKNVEDKIVRPVFIQVRPEPVDIDPCDQA